jgi:hypothetical protein
MVISQVINSSLALMVVPFMENLVNQLQSK